MLANARARSNGIHVPDRLTVFSCRDECAPLFFEEDAVKEKLFKEEMDEEVDRAVVSV